MKLEHPYSQRGVETPSVVTVDGENYRIEDGQLDVSEKVADQLTDAWERRFEEYDNSADREDGPPDSDDSGDDQDAERTIDMQSRSDLESVDHDSLKDFAEDLGIADETDLRSKESIVDAILDETREE